MAGVFVKTGYHYSTDSAMLCIILYLRSKGVMPV